MSKYKNVSKDLDSRTGKLSRLNDISKQRSKNNLTKGAFGKGLKLIDPKKAWKNDIR